MKFYKLKRIKINPLYFNKIIEVNEWVIKKVNNLEELINNPSLYIHNPQKVYYDEKSQSAICKWEEVAFACKLEYGDHYASQVLIVCDSDIDLAERIYETPYLASCTKYINNILLKDYSTSEIEDCLNKCSLSDHQVPIHEFIPYYYAYNTVYKENNCVYYDINNAHLDALCEIFPRSANRLKYIRTLINKYKAEGDKYNARLLKDYVNIYVGGLGKTVKNKEQKIIDYAKHRGTYEWIVKRTRDKLQQAIDFCDGKVLYANTDGVIIKSPKNTIKTSDKLGEFKSELLNDEVYLIAVREENKSPYYLYQFINSKGKMEQKGNCAHEVRDLIDLSKGQFVTFEKVKVDNHFEYKNIEIKKGEVY